MAKLWGGDPKKYLGLDLEGVAKYQRRIANQVLNGEQRPNLDFQAANVLKFDELEKAIAESGLKGPIVIAHEGLFPYLTKDEQAQAASNIHSLLRRYGGVYVNADISIGTSAIKIAQKESSQWLKEKLKRFFRIFNMQRQDMSFQTEEEAMDFYKRNGFDNIQSRDWNHLLDTIPAIDALGIDRENVGRMFAPRRTFVMKVEKENNN